MRIKKVTRYYCDHCSRGNFTRDAMQRHESICFRNPNRSCLVCTHAVPGPELMTALQTGGLGELRSVAKGCPACILAGIIQAAKAIKDVEDKVSYPFHYKSELAEYQGLSDPCSFRD